MFDQPKLWKSWLARAELWYNTSFHTALGCSPFHALYGHEPNMGTMSQPVHTTSISVEDVVQKLRYQIVVLKEHLAKAQNRMKLMADRKTNEKEFQGGDNGLA